MTLATTPTDICDGLEHSFRFLNIIRVPVHEIAMIMSLALRFIPMLMEETDRIVKAQKARGADFESGNFIKRAKALVPVLLPLFISAFRIAQDLSFAMEARCYRGGVGRTRMHEMKLRGPDILALIITFAFFAFMIAERTVL